MLITSFRPEALVDTTGWWTVFAHPVPRRASGRSRTTGRRSTPAGSRTPSSTASRSPIPATVIPITIAAFAAYAFSWMEFRGRYVLFVIVVGAPGRAAADGADPDPAAVHRAAPCSAACAIIPDLDLNGTFLGRLAGAHRRSASRSPSTCCGTTSASLPSSIIESAKIDGADHFTIFWRLVVPLSVPALAAFAIFQFLWVWNDLLVAYVFLGGTRENRVITIALANLVGSRGENWHLLTAAAFISMALPLIVFFSLQRYFVRGLTAGSVKG